MWHFRGLREHKAPSVTDKPFDQIDRMSDVDTKLLKGSVRNEDGAIAVPAFNGDFQRLAHLILLRGKEAKRPRCCRGR